MKPLSAFLLALVAGLDYCPVVLGPEPPNVLFCMADEGGDLARRNLLGCQVQTEAVVVAVPIAEVKLARPLSAAFADAKRGKPLVIRTEKDASKYFGDKALDTIRNQVDFENQYVLLFAWRGSGGDRLEYQVTESKPEQINFKLKPGLTRDLRPHVRVFRVRSGVKWQGRIQILNATN